SSSQRPPYEIPRALHLQIETWTVENGGLTPTHKLKYVIYAIAQVICDTGHANATSRRHYLRTKYTAIVQALYDRTSDIPTPLRGTSSQQLLEALKKVQAALLPSFRAP